MRISGVVRELRYRERDDAGNDVTVLDFRIERHDASGNRLAPVPVRMQGGSISGAVSDGDEIRVKKGKWRDGTLRVHELDNVTTGAAVRTKAARSVGCMLLSLIPLGLMAAFFVFLGLVFYHSVILKENWP